MSASAQILISAEAAAKAGEGEKGRPGIPAIIQKELR
jgi:hypothetical protein